MPFTVSLSYISFDSISGRKKHGMFESTKVCQTNSEVNLLFDMIVMMLNKSSKFRRISMKPRTIRDLKNSNLSDSGPSMRSTYSCVNLKGAASKLKLPGQFWNMKPKSIWMM